MVAWGGWGGRMVIKKTPALVSLIPHADVTVISNYSYNLCVDSYNDILFLSGRNCVKDLFMT